MMNFHREKRNNYYDYHIPHNYGGVDSMSTDESTECACCQSNSDNNYQIIYSNEHKIIIYQIIFTVMSFSIYYLYL